MYHDIEYITSVNEVEYKSKTEPTKDIPLLTR